MAVTPVTPSWLASTAIQPRLLMAMAAPSCKPADGSIWVLESTSTPPSYFTAIAWLASMATALLLALFYLGLAAFRPAAFALPAAFVIVGMKLLRAPLLGDLMNKRIDSRRRATILSGVSMLERAVVFLLYPLVGLRRARRRVAVLCPRVPGRQVGRARAGRPGVIRTRR